LNQEKSGNPASGKENEIKQYLKAYLGTWNTNFVLHDTKFGRSTQSVVVRRKLNGTKSVQRHKIPMFNVNALNFAMITFYEPGMKFLSLVWIFYGNFLVGNPPHPPHVLIRGQSYDHYCQRFSQIFCGKRRFS
jgi:hypothetical protein